jgi:hypothetical protein
MTVTGGLSATGGATGTGGTTAGTGGSGGGGDAGLPDTPGAQPDLATGGAGAGGGTGGSTGVGAGGGSAVGGSGGRDAGVGGLGGSRDVGVPDAAGAQPDTPMGGVAGGEGGIGGVAGSGGVANLDGAFVGGDSGGAASDAAVAACISVADDLIADFTTDSSLNPVDGRQGSFYVFGDGSLAGQFDPPIVSGQPYPIDSTTGNPACSGPGSFHTKATGWGVWGAGLTTDFAPKVLTEAGVGLDGTGFKGTYDASRYRGISFWARATAPLTGVQVSFPDVYTDGGATFAGLPVPDGTPPDFTSCIYSTGRYSCSPYLVKFGSDPAHFPAYQGEAYQIDTTWKRFDVFFADTRQDQYNPGFHTAADKLDTSHLTSMAIDVYATYVNGLATPNDFEIWLDDVSFIR